MRIFFFGIAACAITLLLWSSLRAQSGGAQPDASVESRSVWDGVYTETQMHRGQAMYTERCSTCHGDKLAGKPDEDIPPLTGGRFNDVWNGRTLDALFKKIVRTMPQDDPGRLTPQQTADAVAFILSANKFPAGENELPVDEKTLSGIRIEIKKKSVTLAMSPNSPVRSR